MSCLSFTGRLIDVFSTFNGGRRGVLDSGGDGERDHWIVFMVLGVGGSVCILLFVGLAGWMLVDAALGFDERRQTD